MESLLTNQWTATEDGKQVRQDGVYIRQNRANKRWYVHLPNNVPARRADTNNPICASSLSGAKGSAEMQIPLLLK